MQTRYQAAPRPDGLLEYRIEYAHNGFMDAPAPNHPWTTIPPTKLSVDDYIAFRRDGFLIVRRLVQPEHVEQLKHYTESIMFGSHAIEGVEPPKPGDSAAEMERRLLRVHMLHCVDEFSERYLLYPPILDVVQALQGPDVLALQTMLFFRAPGSDGQGWHQDAYYIPTFPNSLIGAWIAIDPAHADNGCMFMLKGSQNEPIYPPSSGQGYGDWGLTGIRTVSGVGGHSNSDDDPTNGLIPITEKYKDHKVCCAMEPGDVAFFGGNVMHRSYSNRTNDQMRRAFVSHYCNARSFTPWLDGNDKHILARGNTSLGYRKPYFGTPCAAWAPSPSISDRGSTPNADIDRAMGLPHAE